MSAVIAWLVCGLVIAVALLADKAAMRREEKRRDARMERLRIEHAQWREQYLRHEAHRAKRGES